MQSNFQKNVLDTHFMNLEAFIVEHSPNFKFYFQILNFRIDCLVLSNHTKFQTLKLKFVIWMNIQR